MRRRYCQIAALVVVAVAGLLPASGAPFPATVSGVVRDARGTPQMGAVVELMAADATVVARVYTNMRGGYAFDHVLPGTYQVKATGDSLPSHTCVKICSCGPAHIVNLTLSTLFEAVQWLPAQPRSAGRARRRLEMDIAFLGQSSAVALSRRRSVGGACRG